MSTMASRLFAQPFVQAQITENIELRVTGLCESHPPVIGGEQRASNEQMFPFDDVIMRK